MGKRKLLAEIKALEDKLATKWEGMPEGWDNSSRRKYWETEVGNAEHKRTKCHEKTMDWIEPKGGESKSDAAWAFCQSLWDEFENK